jgi:hypothetical protein
MNIAELQRALHQLRLGGMAARAGRTFTSAASRTHGVDRSDLVPDIGRTHAPVRIGCSNAAANRQAMIRSLIFDLAACGLIGGREDALFPDRQESPGSGYRPIDHYSGLQSLLSGSSCAAGRTGRRYSQAYVRVSGHGSLLIIDDFGMRKLPLTAAEDLLEMVMRRFKRASTLLTSNRPVEDWGKLLGETAGVSAMLDRLLHDRHVLKCGPRSWRTKVIPASAA